MPEPYYLIETKDWKEIRSQGRMGKEDAWTADIELYGVIVDDYWQNVKNLGGNIHHAQNSRSGWDICDMR